MLKLMFYIGQNLKKSLVVIFTLLLEKFCFKTMKIFMAQFQKSIEPSIIWKKFGSVDEASGFLGGCENINCNDKHNDNDNETSNDNNDLSNEQNSVIEEVLKGTSLFLTGGAGTGKSHTLKKCIQVLKSVYPIDQIAITGSTGVAALQIGGTTLHSWSGITNSQMSTSAIYINIKLNPRKMELWRRVKVLIIDEISMIDCEFFDKLNEVSKRLRGDLRPFGGIQLLLGGDFFQLPPVTPYSQRCRFAFEASTWKECKLITKSLSYSFRQNDDKTFVDFLNEARVGIISDKFSITLFNIQRNCSTKHSSITPLEMYGNELFLKMKTDI